MKAFIGLLFFSIPLLSSQIFAQNEDFDHLEAGGFKMLQTPYGDWVAHEAPAEIHNAHAASGKNSLRLLGGKNHSLTLHLKNHAKKDSLLTFKAERWTRKDPFAFKIEVETVTGWREIFSKADEIKVGTFSQISVVLPDNLKDIRFTFTSPDGSGVLIDDLSIEAVEPMTIKAVTTIQPVVPALIRKKINPILALKITTEGRLNPASLSAIELNLAGSSNAADIKSVQIFSADSKPASSDAKAFAEAKKSPTTANVALIFSGNTELQPGENFFWVSVELNENASLDHQIDVSILRIQVTNGDKKQTIQPEITSPDGAQRIGFALRQAGDDGSKAFRIPGLATAKSGTLLAVYDVRYRHAGDLPADIDVGLSRSTDGGQTWEKMQVIIDMGNDPKFNYDGVGDPAILVDKKSGRIWVAALWSHGNNGWNGSDQGMEPKETGQIVLVHSDDDGLTWSKPKNITVQVKNKDWHLALPGPGRGITLADGTLVFAAQYQDESKNANGSKKAFSFSTIMWSKDQGVTWHFGNGIKGNTTEAQVVQLANGSLMLNCRDNRGGYRTIGTTSDLGETWTLHPTDRKALPEPVCMASLLKMDGKKYGKRLVFSNPATQNGRYNMTLKFSKDDGMSWPDDLHFLYDSRNGAGYSCLSPVGDDKIGVLYEGQSELYFLRFPLDELLK